MINVPLQHDDDDELAHELMGGFSNCSTGTLVSRMTLSSGHYCRAAARRWRRAGPPGVASPGRRHQLADQPHRREATAMPARPSQRLRQSPINVSEDPVLNRGTRRVDIDLDRAVRQWEKQVSN